jgi:hypothetical protein
MATVKALGLADVETRQSLLGNKVENLTVSFEHSQPAYLSDDHHDHSRPPQPALEVRMTLAGLVARFLRRF